MKYPAQKVLVRSGVISRRVMCGVAALAVAVAAVGCGNKEKKGGQALASVNGDEITVLQLNEELQRSNVPAAQQAVATKQILESLIDRQLLVGEAVKEKLDRDPKVVQAVERAKALILAQVYLQKHSGTVARPTKDEVLAYYEKNPMFFAQRKAFDMRQVVLQTKDINDDVKAAIDSAKSLEDAASWLESHKVAFVRGQVARTTADLPPELSSKLLSMPKGQLFMVKEGERSTLISIADIKDIPQSVEVSAGQIEQFLFNKKNKELADAELARLRAAAKIEYLNKSADAASQAASAPVTTPSAEASAPASTPSDDANARGVAGLK